MRRIVENAFGQCPFPFALRLWTGEVVHVGAGEPSFCIVLREPSAVRSLFRSNDPLQIIDAYLLGHLEVEGSLEAALRLKEYLGAMRLGIPQRLHLGWQARQFGRLASRASSGRQASRRLATSNHSRSADRSAVQFHYDLSNDFYRLWLDEQMVYSCAYFASGGETLDEAQRLKLRHIGRKLRLQPGDRFLDVGCGWGALTRSAAGGFGITAQGITLSERQYEYAVARAEREGLGGRCAYALRDYRDVEGDASFDKIASVGMFEHVGLANLPVYFSSVHRLLKPGGLFLNHGITHDEEGWPDTLGTRFINRYVFPGGQLDRVGNISRGMEQAGFEILDVESLRPHYARTLRCWVERLQQRWDEARGFVSEPVLRLWRLYMLACAVEFESASLGLYQILAAKRGAQPRDLPLSRADLYA